MKVGVSYDTIDVFSMVIVDFEGLRLQRIQKISEKKRFQGIQHKV